MGSNPSEEIMDVQDTYVYKNEILYDITNSCKTEILTDNDSLSLDDHSILNNAQDTYNDNIIQDTNGVFIKTEKESDDTSLDDCNDYIFHDSYDVVPSKESCFLKEEVIEDIEGLSYDCKECLERFTTLDDLNIHEETHPKLDKPICEGCMKQFSSTTTLLRHIKLCEHTSNKHFRSTHSKCFLKSDDLTDLLKTHPYKNNDNSDSNNESSDNNNEYLCPKCDKSLYSPYNVKRHLKKCTGEKTPPSEVEKHACCLCNKSYNRPYRLREHYEKHCTNDRSCPVCGIQFEIHSLLRKHLYSHIIKEPYSKEECERKKFVCEICNKRYLYRRDLVSHIKTHSGLKPFPCEVCGKSFTAFYRLCVHQRKYHNITSKYICKGCKKQFAHSGSLHTHMKMCEHTTEKYLCTLCCACFITPYDLKQHKRSCGKKERKEKKQSTKTCMCTECGKCYFRNSELKRHIKIKHLGANTRTICDICGKNLHARSLQKHKNKKHTRLMRTSGDKNNT